MHSLQLEFIRDLVNHRTPEVQSERSCAGAGNVPWHGGHWLEFSEPLFVNRLFGGCQNVLLNVHKKSAVEAHTFLMTTNLTRMIFHIAPLESGITEALEHLPVNQV